MADTETRIVEMRFDNRDFERNIAKSKKSLEDFKKDLDFQGTAKGLQEFADNVNHIDFQGMATNIERLKDKFTGLGDAGEWAMSRIRAGIEKSMLKMEDFLKSFTTVQVGIGQGKYDAMNKAAQSMIATGEYTEKQAYEVFERVMAYTDQTSANFTSMSDSLASMVSSGQGLQSVERALEGIFNMSAKAGRGANEASIAMTTFSKAVNQGYLSKNNWDSLSLSARITTAEFKKELIKAAVATGDLIEQNGKFYIAQKYRTASATKEVKKNSKVTEKEKNKQEDLLKKYEVTAENLADVLRYKWASKDTLMAFFDKYYLEELDPDKAAKTIEILEEAVKSNETSYQQLAKAMDSAKIPMDGLNKRLIEAAVKTGDLTEKNGKYYTNSKKFGKQVEVTAKNVAEIFGTKAISKDTIGAILSDYKFAETAYKSAQRALTFADAMNAVKESISSGWMQTFRHVFGDVTEAMETFTNLCNKVIDSISGLKDARNAILEVWAANGGRSDLVSAILGDYGKDVETGAYGLLDLFEDVGKIVSQGFWDMMKIITGGQNEGNWDQEGFKEAWLGLKLKEVTKSITDFVTSVKSFFTEEVKVGDGTTTRLEMIQNIVKGISGILAFSAQLIVGVIYFTHELRKQLQPTIDSITNFFGKLGEILYDTSSEAQQGDSVKKFFDDLLTILKPLTSVINTVVESFTNLLLAFIEWGKNSGAFESIGKIFTHVFNVISAVIERVAAPVLGFLADMFDILAELFTSGFDEKKMAGFGEKIRAAFQKMIAGIVGVENWDEVSKVVAGVLANVVSMLPEGIKGIITTLTSLGGTISTLASPVLTFFGDLFGIIVDLFSSGFSPEKLKGFGGKISEAMTKMLSSIVNTDSWGSIIERVQGFFGNLNKALPKSVQSVISTIKRLFGITQKVTKKPFAAKPIGIIASAGASDVGFGSGKNGLKQSQETLEAYAEQAEKTNLGTVLSMIVGDSNGILSSIYSMFGEMDFSNIVENIFGKIKSAISWAIGLFKDDNFTAVFRVITGAAALFGIHSIVKNFKKTTGSITGFFYSLSGAVKKFTGTSSIDKWKVVGTTILQIALAILSVVGAVVVLAKIPLSDLLKAGGAIVAIMVAMFLLVKGLNKGANKLEGQEPLAAALQMLALGVSIRSLGTAVKVIAKAVEPFSKMDDGQFLKAIGAIVAIMGMMIFLVLSISKKGVTKGELRGVGVLAIGIAAIMLAIIPVSKLPIEKIAVGLAPVLGILVMFGLFIAAIKKMKASSVEITGLAGLAGGIALIMLVLLPIALMPWKALLKMGVGLLAVLAMLAGFVFAIKKIGASSVKMTGMIGLAVGIGLLVLALIPLALFPKKALTKAVLALVGIVGSLALLAYAAKSFKISGFLGLLAIIGVIIVMVESIKHISDADAKQMIAFAASVAIIAIGFGAAMLLLAKVPFLKGLGAVVMLGLFVAEMAAIFHFMKPMFESIKELMKDVDGDLMIKFAVSLGLVLVALSASITFLSLVPFTAGIKGILLFGIAMITLAGLLSWLVPIFIGEVGNSIAELSAKLTLAGDMIEKFSTQMNAMDDSGISKAGQIFDNLNKQIEKLTTFADSAETITRFTTALYELATGLESWQTHTANIVDPESANAFKMIEKVSGLGNTLASFSVGNFATEVVKLGASMAFFDFLGEDIGDVNNSKPLVLLQNLAGCADDLKTLSTLGLDSLKDQIAGLGGAMSLYALGASEITGVEGDQTTNIQGAMAILQEISKTFAEEGGFTIPSIPGDSELNDFGIQLATLAGALVRFAEASNGLGEGTDKAIELLGFLANLKTNLTKENLETAKQFNEAGVSGDVMTQFSTDIFTLGSGLKHFINSVKDIDSGKMETATKALDFFEKLKAKLVTQDAVLAVINFFTGNNIQNNQLVQFGKDIEALGSALKTFATSVSWDSDTQGSFQQALDALQFLSDLQSTLPNIGGIVELFAGRQQTLSDLAAEIVLLGDAISKFNAAIVNPETGESKLDTNGMTEAVKVMGEFVGLLGNMQTTLNPVGGYLEAFTGHSYNATNFADDMTSFTTVVEELIKIGALLNNQDGEHSIPTEQNLNDALHVLAILVNFLSMLQRRLGRVGGIIEAWEGKDYDATQLLIDVNSFKKVLGEMFEINEMLHGRNEEVKLLGEQDLPDAIAVVKLITDYLAGLKEQFGTVGGIVEQWKGKDYDATQLTTDVGKFKETVGILLGISDMLAGKDETVKMLKEEDLPNAVAAIDVVVTFLKELRRKIPPVGGWVNNLTRAIAGKPYDLDLLNTDLTNFKTACGHLVDISQKLTGSGENAININEGTMKSAETAVSTILSFVTRLGTDMDPIGGFLNDVDAAWNGRKYTVDDLKKDLDGFGKSCEELVNISTVLTGENGSSPLISETILSNSLSVMDRILEFSKSLGEKAPKVGGMQKFLNSLWTGGDYTFENLRDDLQHLGEGMGAFSTGLGTGFNAEAALGAVDIAYQIVEILSGLQDIGTKTNSGSFVDVEANIQKLSEFLQAMNEGYDISNSNTGKNIPPMIDNIVALAKAVSDAVEMSGGINPQSISMFSQMAYGIQQLSKTDPSFDFEPVGTNIALGIKRGIENTQSQVTEAARSLAIATYNAAMEALHAHSPSRLFMEVGDFITAGMAIGIDDGSSDVQNAIKDMSGDTFKTATNVLAIISQMLSEEINANPTITPVLDLTDLSNGITMMNGMLDGGRMSIDTRNAAILAASNIPHSTTTETNQNGTDLSGVYSRMAELGEKITEMSEQIAKMKVVLDTGAIAGAVTDQVDARIGAKAFYAGRGN